MLQNFDSLDPVQRYRWMIQSIIPRPVAWTLTRNEQDSFNLAPFSYFNAVCSDPALILISIGKKRDGSYKDTRANILREKEFMIHIASAHLAEAVTKSSLAFDAGESEVEQCGLELIHDFKTTKLPRLKDCQICFHCELYRYEEIGATKQGLIFGEIKSMFVEDGLILDKDKIDAMGLNPLGRLGGDDYGTLGKVLTIERPPYTPY